MGPFPTYLLNYLSTNGTLFLTPKKGSAFDDAIPTREAKANRL